MNVILQDMAMRGRFDAILNEQWFGGERVSVIGPTGSGKSSLLDAVSGFVRPTSGTVTVAHGATIVRVEAASWRSNVVSASRIARLGLGRSFQEAERFGTLTVQQTFDLIDQQRGRGVIDGAIFDLLWRILQGVGVDKNRLMHSLSFGQARVVGLACACVIGRNGVILDEPSTGVATECRPLIARLLELMSEQGRLVIAAEHHDGVLRNPTRTINLQK